MLHNLKWLKGKINKTQDGDAQPNDKTGASQRSENIKSETKSDDNASSPDPAIQDEATPTPEQNQPKEPNPTDVKQPTPSPVATDLQTIAVGDVTDALCGLPGNKVCGKGAMVVQIMRVSNATSTDLKVI
ncbi:hypothetical protein BBBOND_0302060 [Babesia bigemina]|uniref:Uncharacterized protein n=1 Tax=Babesia bigemina TaxID=5866 RepID=A0A061D8N7_BABBI|nr:hypothetical protein BBBOND_0302060 [Babesia bigemina]CDR96302.1 hypothetical protein BBBOND_0302060 [Babesia bigemina]|eukprot:XP_012768488.1 hypothetical protein BBBOND_0302060 [Babesia bigemina]